MGKKLFSSFTLKGSETLMTTLGSRTKTTEYSDSLYLCTTVCPFTTEIYRFKDKQYVHVIYIYEIERLIYAKNISGKIRKSWVRKKCVPSNAKGN